MKLETIRRKSTLGVAEMRNDVEVHNLLIFAY